MEYSSIEFDRGRTMTIMASGVYLPEDVNLEAASVRLERDMLAFFGRAEVVAWVGAAESNALERETALSPRVEGC